MKYFLILILFLPCFAKASLISVKIDFLEALSPKDTTSSERFQKEYEAAISTAKKLAEKQLSKCGYQIEDKAIFYNASDPLESLERSKSSEKSGAWLLVGPRRSNHYILLAKGAPKTPSVSTMASSDEIKTLGNLHLTIAPMNEQMAAVAAKEMKKKFNKNGTYISIVSEDCISCVDFASHFNKIAKNLGLKLLKEIKVAGESPILTESENAVKTLKPSFILLPNYSKVSAQAIAALYKVNQKLIFVGGDGWGDSKFGFVDNAAEIEKVKGITVRGFPPVDEALKQFGFGKELLKNKDPSLSLPGSGSALGIIKILEDTTKLLCINRPKSKDDFVKAFEKNGKIIFKPHWGVSIYELKRGDISFLKTVRLN